MTNGWLVATIFLLGSQITSNSAQAGAEISGLIRLGENEDLGRHVTVTISDGTGPGTATVTDEDGRFLFVGVPSGRYFVTASRPAYLTTAYGQYEAMRAGLSARGTAVIVRSGQVLSDLHIRLPRGGVVDGTVRGPDGEPIPGAAIAVSYLVRSPVASRPILAPAPSGLTTTDGDGHYRVFGLPPGKYFISASPPLSLAGNFDSQAATSSGRNRRVGFAAVFYPGAFSQREASSIEIGPGDERTGLDIQLSLVGQASVTGVVLGEFGEPALGVNVRLSNPDRDGGVVRAINLMATTDGAGRFVMNSLPPGNYRLEARGVPSQREIQAPTFWALRDISVSGDTDVETTLLLRRTSRLSGAVTLEPELVGGNAPMQALGLSLKDAITGIASGRVQISGSGFTIEDVVPGTYRLFASTAARNKEGRSWVISKTSMGTQDVTDRAFEVVPGTNQVLEIRLTDRAAEIAGVLASESGRPVVDCRLIIFPIDQANWYWQSRWIRETKPDVEGTYRMIDLPPGDYYLSAVNQVDENEWFDRDFLQLLARTALTITLRAGETTRQNLRAR